MYCLKEGSFGDKDHTKKKKNNNNNKRLRFIDFNAFDYETLHTLSSLHVLAGPSWFNGPKGPGNIFYTTMKYGDQMALNVSCTKLKYVL